MIARSARLLLVSAFCCQAADLYHVAGSIINAQTGAPLPNARINVMATGTTHPVASQTTGVDGKFAFDLPEGKFNLVGGTRDLIMGYGLRRPDSLMGTSIVTGPGKDVASLVFQWFPTAAVSGRIVDEAGEPVESADVQLIRSIVWAGRRITNTFAWARSDDRGEYRFGRLVGGTYYLAVSGSPWYARQRLESPSANAEEAFATAFYPQSPNLAHAGALLLSPGEEARADFALHTVPGATVQIEYDNPVGLTGLIGLVTEGVAGSDGYQRQDRVVPFRQFMRGVPPGHYRVQLNGNRGTARVTARQEIDVNGAPVQVKLIPHPAPTVTGSVQFAGAKPQATVLISLVWEDSTRVAAISVQPDGTFTYPNLSAGKFRVALGGKDGLFASEVQVEGAAFQNGVVDLIDGASATIRIVATRDIGRVRGFVKRGEQPVSGMMVVLFPIADPSHRLPNHGFQTDSDGSFDWPNIPSGNYFLFAIDDPNLEYMNPKAVTPYKGKAVQVRVEAGGTVSQDLQVSEIAVPN